ncbi:MAG: hypothetical protein ABI137_00820 [Antricoccus sp.]
MPNFRLPDKPVRPDLPWSIGHLRSSLIATALLLVLGVPLAWIIADFRSALGVAVGLLIVAVFFSISAWAVMKAGSIDDRLTLPAALGTYAIKIGLLGVVVLTMPLTGPINVRAMALAVLVGTLTWTAMQIHYVMTRRIFYVDYTPPSDQDHDQ